ILRRAGLLNFTRRMRFGITVMPNYEFQSMVQDGNNLLHNLYREVEFWTGQIREPNHCNIYERISKDPDSINECSPIMIKIVDDLIATGVRPKILDIGSGPFSTMYYFKRSDKADVHAVDILAREYRDLLCKFGFGDVLMPEFATGENLDLFHGGEQFD